MQIRPDGYIDNFKHTLQHLARKWYHSLDITEFHDDWHEFTNILADTSLHKGEILSIYMKGGKPFHLIYLLMTLKSTSEM